MKIKPDLNGSIPSGVKTHICHCERSGNGALASAMGEQTYNVSDRGSDQQLDFAIANIPLRYIPYGKTSSTQ
ncbi:MAG: hypothetical protein AAF378_16995 [Cyanobacteria bacterium P01_A01_bin.84]